MLFFNDFLCFTSFLLDFNKFFSELVKASFPNVARLCELVPGGRLWCAASPGRPAAASADESLISGGKQIMGEASRVGLL